MPHAPLALVAFTGLVLLAGYLIVIATFKAGIAVGRVMERAQRGHW